MASSTDNMTILSFQFCIPDSFYNSTGYSFFSSTSIFFYTFGLQEASENYFETKLAGPFEFWVDIMVFLASSNLSIRSLMLTACFKLFAKAIGLFWYLFAIVIPAIFWSSPPSKNPDCSCLSSAIGLSYFLSSFLRSNSSLEFKCGIFGNIPSDFEVCRLLLGDC